MQYPNRVHPVVYIAMEILEGKKNCVDIFETTKYPFVFIRLIWNSRKKIRPRQALYEHYSDKLTKHTEHNFFFAYCCGFYYRCKMPSTIYAIARRMIPKCLSVSVRAYMPMRLFNCVSLSCWLCWCCCFVSFTIVVRLDHISTTFTWFQLHSNRAQKPQRQIQPSPARLKRYR